MKRSLWVWLFLLSGVGGHLYAQSSASFNFSLSSHPVTGWVNVSGDPSATTRTGVSGSIHVSSGLTSNWSQFSGTAAFDGGGMTGASFFPAAVMANMWFQYSTFFGAYSAGVPQLLISGLSVDSVYTVKMSASFNANTFDFDPTRYSVMGANIDGYTDVNVNSNLTGGAVFNNVVPDSNGDIRIYVNTVNGSNTAGISGLQITSGHTTAPVPTVAITTPHNSDVLPEDGNVAITATASETNGSIAVVQFFANSTLIGADSSAPYSITWFSPDEGAYTIMAKAIDGQGNSNTATINASVESLTSFWSMTGNINMNPDSNFVGNVDSVRLAFRTKDIERMSISPTGNVGIGTIAPTAQLHTTGTVRLAGVGFDSAGTGSRVLVSDTSGNLRYRNASNIGLTVGDGLGQTASGALTIGDSIPGPGPHSFMSNRYQYLNGFQYSIGGSVNDPVTSPNFRIYNNGDLTAGTTMDRSVNTTGQTGMRYYSKLGMLQLGGSDRLDTTQSKVVTGSWPNSGLLINSDTANTIKGRFMNTVFAGDANTMDTTTRIENSVVATESAHFTSAMGTLMRSFVSGSGHVISAPVDASIISGKGQVISKYSIYANIGGFQNTTMDSAVCSLVAGSNNKFGGYDQLVVGQYLVNRSPYGTTLGNSNVDFATLPYTGEQGAAVPGIGGYPLFAVGNSSANDGSVHSNAITVLFNGRTQINTAGFTNALAQTDVTPKAALEVVSNNSGVLLPKLTTAQRNAIVTGDLYSGLLLYNTDSNSFQFYNGSAWTSVGAASIGSSGSGGWGVSGNTGTNPASNFIGTTDTERLVFRTDNIERMTILAGGAIGIGTSTLPTTDSNAKLAVDGTVYTTKVRVTQLHWPDYVFDKGYSLPSLVRVEQYIRQHRHLPGILSAGEVQQQRVDLGDNQSALLKKVEELTLYLIEEHKKADGQQKEIERLREQNKRLDQQQKEIDQLKEMLEKYTGNK
jgi:Bacterial Ig domain